MNTINSSCHFLGPSTGVFFASVTTFKVVTIQRPCHCSQSLDINGFGLVLKLLNKSMVEPWPRTCRAVQKRTSRARSVNMLEVT